MGKLLKDEHALLVGVQHVTGMWVLRGMRMKSYFSALRVEATDAAKFNGIEAALSAGCSAARCYVSGWLPRHLEGESEEPDGDHGV